VKRIPIATAVVVNAALVLFGRGSLLQFVFVSGAMVWVALPAAAIASVLYFVQRPRFARAAGRFAAVTAVCASTGISLVPGGWVLKNDIAQAQAFCEASVPRLDQYQRTHGAYPAEISQVTTGAPPYLLRAEHFYQSDGRTFAFFFSDPAGIMIGFRFASDNRQWVAWWDLPFVSKA